MDNELKEMMIVSGVEEKFFIFFFYRKGKKDKNDNW